MGVGFYYALINLTLFIMMAIDKHKARKSKWRISETTLLLTGLLGGAAGGLIAMRFVHHKNRKPYFYMVFICAIIIHIFAISFLSTLILS
ncbi:MAG: DUF1294 domain-containing protein [Lachnospiraceae bacterium]|nr:DUF1294 domain-containing protein [Lachnospiraceae bacterium]